MVLEVVADIPADVEVDSARLLEVEVLGADARQPEVETEQHQDRFHRYQLVGAQHRLQTFHGEYLKASETVHFLKLPGGWPVFPAENRLMACG